MKRLSLFLVAAAAASLWACGVNPVEQSTGSSGDAIVKGTPTTGFPNVVAVYAHVPDAGTGALCTGEVVAPNVVLTAAHCVHPDEVGEGAVFKVFTGYDLTDAGTRGDALAVTETHFDPAWSSTNLPGGHDFGVVILEQPTDITPLPINRTALDSSLQGAPATIVGYGLSNGITQTGAEVKRTATVKLNSISDQFVTTGSWFGSTICSGDSGGPVLVDVNGVTSIVGVNSFGPIGCIGPASSTRPDTNLDFIDQYVPLQ